MTKRIIALFITTLLISSAAMAQKKTKIYKKTIPRKGEVRLDAELVLGGGTIFLQREKSGNLFSARVKYDASKLEPLLEIHRENDEAKLYFHPKRWDKSGEDFDIHFEPGDEWDDLSPGISSIRSTEWDLNVTGDIPVKFRITAGATKANLDFTGLMVEYLKITTGASKMLIRFNEPNPVRLSDLDINVGVAKFKAKKLLNANFDTLNYEGGLGSAHLDFSGELDHHAEVNIDVGMGFTSIYIESGVAAKVYADVSLFTSFDITGLDKVRKNVYQSSNWNQTEGELVIRIKSSGIGTVDIEYGGF